VARLAAYRRDLGNLTRARVNLLSVRVGRRSRVSIRVRRRRPDAWRESCVGRALAGDGLALRARHRRSRGNPRSPTCLWWRWRHGVDLGRSRGLLDLEPAVRAGPASRRHRRPAFRAMHL